MDYLHIESRPEDFTLFRMLHGSLIEMSISSYSMQFVQELRILRQANAVTSNISLEANISISMDRLVVPRHISFKRRDLHSKQNADFGSTLLVYVPLGCMATFRAVKSRAWLLR